MQTSESPILLNVISLNTGTANNFEVRASKPVITMGRGPTCTVRINDQRCSNTHCRLTIEPENPTQLKVEDLSSNGTFLNNALVFPT
jgi:pSer/pThr/pTyr-binding forkhead associated (FHA) protein